MSNEKKAPVANDDNRPSYRRAIVAGILVTTAFFGGLGAWAALAPLDSAAIAPGVVSVESQRKTVQHLEGGIIDEILVREGDRVEAGELLIRLDDTQHRTNYQLLRGRLLAAKALEARLIARRDARGAIDFPSELTGAGPDAGVAEMIDGQRTIFAARNQSIASQTAILEQRVAALDQEIVGLDGEIAAQDRQLALIEEELEGLSELFDKGLARKERILALRRTAADIEGARARNVAGIARARQSIGGARLEIDDLRTNILNLAVEELRETQKEIFDVAQRIVSIEDVLARTEIRAPLSGTVVALQVHSTRGVVTPGAPLLDIVPANEKLIVEAQVSPDDIDIVHAELQAQVQFTSFDSRTTVPVDGVVRSVSADRLTDERSGVSYFTALVEITGAVDEALDGGELSPGMPAQVMILTGRRTPLDYLVSPVTDSMRRAFRED